MARSSALQSTGELRLGDHVCMVYETEQEHARILTPYLRAGLERNEKVVYLSDYTTGVSVLRYLEDAGLAVEPYRRKGQLLVHSASDVYLQNGSFDPSSMIEFLGQATAQALREGFAGLRATGEMTWVLEGRPGCERILEYEARTNGFFTSPTQAVGLCQYRRSRFDPRMLLEILKTHPIAGVGEEFYENPFYIPPDLYLGAREPNAMVERCLAVIQDRPPLRRRRGPSRPARDGGTRAYSS